jgi:L-cysteate sulfo-lyase
MTMDIDGQLARFPTCELGHLPTPLDPLPRLTRLLNGPEILIKRDDGTGLATGGNKTRKLEFVIGDALARGVDTLITNGGVQSNHARQTAAAAAKLGLHCELFLSRVLDEPAIEYLESGNVLLDRLLGAEVKVISGAGAVLGGSSNDTDKQVDIDALMAERAEELRRAGRNPLVVPLGASTPLGALGYVRCAAEILEQATELDKTVDAVVVASGSAGTQAGLLAGFHALEVPTRVIGIGVSNTDQSWRRDLVHTVASEAAALLDCSSPVPWSAVHVLGEYVGEGYGLFGGDVVDALKTVARSEGILLDPVYTGKAMVGLMDLVKRGELTADQTVVFVHTGGTTGLAAYSGRLSALLDGRMD